MVWFFAVGDLVDNHTSKVVRKHPEWLKVRAPQGGTYSETVDIVRKHKLRTVCEEAACPNVGECWNKKHATFMILGSVCTRACAFCNIKTGAPDEVDPYEPYNIASAIKKMGFEACCNYIC